MLRLCIAVVLAVATPLAAADAPSQVLAMPRITVRDGRFVRADTGQLFVPRGFNYEQFKPQPLGYLGTFSPRRYDAPAAQRMLENLAAHRFNVVRVFLDPGVRHGEGIVESASATELSAAYMANWLDFLGRARGQGIYVITTLDGLPASARYTRIIGQAPADIAGVNRTMLHQGHIDAYAQHVADVLGAVRDHDPSLLSTLLAFQLWNESYYGAVPPFSTTTGTVRAADGNVYDCSSRQELQRMADEHAIRWADACVAAARSVDPQIMVTTGVFTFAAVGRSGPAQVRPEDSTDARIPFRPLALVRSKLSFLDIHLYPFGPQTLKRDLESIEFDRLSVAARERGMPLVMGEFGAFRRPYPTLDSAIAAMRRHIADVMDLGFAGYLYWTYDTHSQRELWNAQSEDRAMFRFLAELNPTRP